MSYYIKITFAFVEIRKLPFQAQCKLAKVLWNHSFTMKLKNTVINAYQRKPQSHFSSKIVSDKLCKCQSYKTSDSIQKKSQNPPRSWDSSSGNGYCQNVLTSSNF